MRPGPLAAWAWTLTLPKRRYLVLVRVGAWPSCQTMKAAPLPSVLSRASWRLSLMVDESAVQKEVNWSSSQEVRVKSKEVSVAKAGSGGQSFIWRVSSCV
jgi:hypothetical protein